MKEIYELDVYKLAEELSRWKLETRDLILGGLRMKEIHELDVYKLSENLSDLIWYGFDAWQKKVQQTIGYQIIRAADSIASNIAGSAP
jgi:hypothetical protein